MISLRVTDETGTRHVQVTQRELAAWEAEPFGTPGHEAFNRRPNLAARWLAWRAEQFAGATKLTWPKWDQAVAEVGFADPEDDQEDEQTPRPTRRRNRSSPAPDESGSTSP